VLTQSGMLNTSIYFHLRSVEVCKCFNMNQCAFLRWQHWTILSTRPKSVALRRRRGVFG